MQPSGELHYQNHKQKIPHNERSKENAPKAVLTLTNRVSQRGHLSWPATEMPQYGQWLSILAPRSLPYSPLS